MNRVSVLGLAMLVGACASPLEAPESDEGLPIQTDRLVYELRRTDRELLGEISFAFTNRTGKTVYVVNCNGVAPPSLEKLVDGEWVPAWSAVVPACLSAPIVIEPGKTYTSTLEVYAGLPGMRIAPIFEVAEIEGTYRLVWHPLVHDYDSDRPGFGVEVPLEQRTSNPFVLKEE